MMKNWRHVVRGIRPLLNAFDPEQHSSAENIKAIHSIVSKHRCFDDFEAFDEMEEFTDTGDKEYDMERANAIIECVWDYADANSIWIE